MSDPQWGEKTDGGNQGPAAADQRDPRAHPAPPLAPFILEGGALEPEIHHDHHRAQQQDRQRSERDRDPHTPLRVLERQRHDGAAEQQQQQRAQPGGDGTGQGAAETAAQRDPQPLRRRVIRRGQVACRRREVRDHGADDDRHGRDDERHQECRIGPHWPARVGERGRRPERRADEEGGDEERHHQRDRDHQCRIAPRRRRRVGARRMTVEGPQVPSGEAARPEHQQRRRRGGKPRRVQVDEHQPEDPRRDQQSHQKQREHEQVQRRVADPDRHHRPGVGGKKSAARRQIVAVFAQKPNRPHVIGRRIGVVERVAARIAARDRAAQRLLDRRDRTPPLDPGEQPGADVSSAGDGREIVDARQPAGAGETLQDPQVERRAADAAA